jgi:hypothetical protein
MSHRSLLQSIAGLALLAALPTAASAQARKSVKEALPANTLVYFSVPDLDRSFEEFQKAPLFKIWREEEVQEFFKQPLAMAKEKIDEGLGMWREMHKAGKVPVDPDQAMKLRLKGFTFALSDLVLPGPDGKPNVGLLVALDFGSTQPGWKALIDGLLELAKGRPGYPGVTTSKAGGAEVFTLRPPKAPPFISLNWAWAGSSLVVSFSESTLASVLQSMAGEGKSPVLADSADYKKVFSRFKSAAPSVEVFARPAALVQLGLDGLSLAEQSGADFPPQLKVDGVKRAVDALGLLSCEAVASVGGYDNGRGVFEQYALLPAAKRKGLMARGNNTPLDLKRLSLVPKEAVGFSYSRTNIAGFLDVLIDAAKAYDPEIAEQGLVMLKSLEEQIGVKVREDLFGQIGDEFLYYSMKPTGMASAPEMGIIMPVKDGQKLVQALKSLAKLSDGKVTITEKADKTMKDLVVYSLDIDVPNAMGGAGFNPLAMFTPYFAIHEGNLVVSFARADVKRAIKRFAAGSEGNDITAADSFKLHKDLIAKGQFTHLSFDDWPPVFEAYYNQLTNVASIIPIPEEIPINLASLPTAEAFTKHLYSAVSFGTSDADGSYSVSISPFGPEVVVGVVVAAAAAAAGGVAWSAEQRGMRARARAPEAEVEEQGDPTKIVPTKKKEGEAEEGEKKKQK